MFFNWKRELVKKENEKQLRHLRQELWKTRDGRLVPVSAMTNNHLINTWKILHTKKFVEWKLSDAWKKMFEHEMERRKILHIVVAGLLAS